MGRVATWCSVVTVLRGNTRLQLTLAAVLAQESDSHVLTRLFVFCMCTKNNIDLNRPVWGFTIQLF